MNNITSILGDLGISFKGVGQHHHSTEGWVSIHCPWCRDGKSGYHLGVNLKHGNTSCWKCGPHSLADVLFHSSKLPFNKCIELAKGFAKIRGIARAKRGKTKLPVGIGGMRSVHTNYLRRRGFVPSELARLWGVRGIGLAGRLSWSLFIPNVQNGETVSWTTRSVQTNGQRYISASPEEESVSPKDVLFGEDYCRNTIIICEGPFDVFRIGPGAVALMGSTASDSQISRIVQYPLRVVCLDSGKDSQRGAKVLCGMLSQFSGNTVNVELDSADPGEATKQEVKQLRDEYLDC